MLITKITPRQLEFVRDYAAGFRIVDIAEKYGLNRYTVRNTLKNAREANEAETNAQLVVWAIKDDFLSITNDGAILINDK